MTKAKKSYGQHFLRDESICEDIASYILGLQNIDLIIEVGPGTGALTKHLMKGRLPFVAIEADRDMLFELHRRLPELKQDQVILSDFLKVDLSSLIQDKRVAIVGNFPYNISTQIVFKVLENRSEVMHMVGMFQKEVSDRIIAPHGTKVYGILSVLSAAFYSGKTIMKVGPQSFSPPPKVQSSVIHLERKEIDSPIENFSFFKRVVKAVFGQRRKMLRNSLRTIGLRDMDTSHDLFSKRPEQMPLEDFILMTKMLEKNGLS